MGGAVEAEIGVMRPGEETPMAREVEMQPMPPMPGTSVRGLQPEPEVIAEPRSEVCSS
ncbi:hypothetical protein [Neptuniibacter sp.]|uniref:hypothetical protein n=1 Tax=Neptuniibacter sp. TaxID=1962643 RepID=UPI002630C9F8|nr:hypothetical protein [Neptuniibacter sp.]MCP4596976.1 hypothetical protein [Neptuniibacter sp.]